MDAWYLVFGAMLIFLGLFAAREEIPGRDIAVGLCLVTFALGGGAGLGAMMEHVERWTPVLSTQAQSFRGAAPPAHWTRHQHRRERDGCSTSGGFDQCNAETNHD